MYCTWPLHLFSNLDSNNRKNFPLAKLASQQQSLPVQRSRDQEHRYCWSRS